MGTVTPIDRTVHRVKSVGELEDKILEFIQASDVFIENSGIGAYEFWGAKGYDRGNDYALYEGPNELFFEVKEPLEDPSDLDHTYTWEVSHPKGEFSLNLKITHRIIKNFFSGAFVFCEIEQVN